MENKRTNKEIGSIVRSPEPKRDVLMAYLGKEHLSKPEPIVCKFCGSIAIVKYGVRNGVQNYICKNCGRKFIDKDAPVGMRTPAEQIGASLNMFYDSISITDISRHLNEAYNNPVHYSSVYRWIVRYTVEAIRILEPLKPTVSDTWVVVETVIRVGGINHWFWGVIDERTHFLLASHLSQTRGISDVMTVMRKSRQRAGKTPSLIISDRLGVYPDGIERIFGADTKHIQTREFTEIINTNVMKRFHDTIKARYKVLSGFKTTDKAKLIQEGFRIHYNFFFKPRRRLGNRTPAEVAQIKAPVRGWTEVLMKAE